MAQSSKIDIDECERPRILAIETSGRQGSIALARGGELLEEVILAAASKHATGLLPAVEGLFSKHGWKPGELKQVYVSTGPGSFTGLRIAIAVARSLALATGCRLVGVPTLDVIAENAPAGTRELVVVLDAKRGQTFAARYRDMAKDGDGAGRRLVRTEGPALVDPAAFVRGALEEAAGAGDEPVRVVVLGEGVEYHRAALAAGAAGAGELVEAERGLWAGRASAVHRLGWRMAQAGGFTAAGELLPVYIRLAEAEELWNKRHGAGQG